MPGPEYDGAYPSVVELERKINGVTEGRDDKTCGRRLSGNEENDGEVCVADVVEVPATRDYTDRVLTGEVEQLERGDSFRGLLGEGGRLLSGDPIDNSSKQHDHYLPSNCA